MSVSQTTLPHKTSKSANILFLTVTGVVFLALTVVFVCLPRETYSHLEKRDLAEFPDYKDYKNTPGKYTAAVSHWFSDTEPYRDTFMSASMELRGMMRATIGSDEEAVTFRPTAPDASGSSGIPGSEGMEETAPIEGYELPAEGSAKIASSGILIVGSGPKTRALMAFGGTPAGGGAFVEAVNAYAKALPDVKVYALVAPLATEFYLPAKAAKSSKPQAPFIESVRKRLDSGVHFVDAYSNLKAHVDEDIYLRTDHHWSPLGGYYAAQAFAKSAGVPFKTLDSYERKTVRNFVGSMFGYSKDISIKNAPEDFVYYVPKGLDYQTTYTNFTVNKAYKVTSVSKPVSGQYFVHFKDGSGAAYCTFMGSDQRLTQVKTGTDSKRRLLVIKDSYGNAIPGYLFYSFGEIHVVDFRYFNRNIKDYVKEHGITDLLVAVNVYNAYSGSTAQKIKGFLGQKNGAVSSADTPEGSKPGKDVHEAPKSSSELPVKKEHPASEQSASMPKTQENESPAEHPHPDPGVE